MTLGTNYRRAATVLALAISATVMTGCGSDEDSTSSGRAPSAGAEAPSEAAPESTEVPVPTETTPTVEPATGLLLRLNYAELRMPKGWRRRNNYGVPFLRQGASDAFFGIITWTELNDAGTDEVMISLDSIAKRQLRSLKNPRVKRLDDVVIGGDTMAYRLAGQASKYDYEEYYGVLIGNLEYSIEFDFNTVHGTVDEASAIIESILATWEFNP